MSRAPLCSIWVYAPLELVHLDYTSIESMMELNKPPMVKNVLMMMDHFTRYTLAVCDEGPDCQDCCEGVL